MRRVARREAVVSTGVLWLLGVAACGGSDSSSVACGDGTTLQGDTCVAVDAGTTTNPKHDAGSDDSNKPDDSTKTDAGSASTDAGSPSNPAAISCGAGTVEKDGKCVVDPSMQLACGDGTQAMDGKCVVPPPPKPKLEGMVISQLSLRNHGQLVTDGSQIKQFYPVDVSIGLTYHGPAERIPVVVALGEPPDPDKTADQEKDLGFCLVGGFYIDHPGGSTDTESIASATLQIPKGCLSGSQNTLTVSPIVLIDPDETIGAENQDDISRTVVFAKKNDVDPDMAACRIDAATGGTTGTCQVEAQLNASPGLDFDLAELTAESSVVVIDKCPDGADPDRPASYRCNHSIVPEFAIMRDNAGKPVLDSNGNEQIILDGDGKPVQATYDNNGTQLPKWVYGPADLDLDVTVLSYGANNSKISSADDATDQATDDSNAVNNVLSDHGLQILYTIRPAESTDANAWRPLYLHKQGEQAKAGEPVESGQDQTTYEETKLVPATPSYYSHGLYVENDCGERNLATCDMNVHPRTDIVSGDWSNSTDFMVRACLVPVDDSGATDMAFDDNPDNNCREIPIKIVRHDTASSTAMAASYGFNFQWADGVGSQSTLRLGWDMHTWNKVDTSGATTDNQAAITLGSDLIGYTDVLKGWAKGAAYVSLTGSYYDYGISTFGIKLWGDSKTIADYHWTKDWNVSKTLSRSAIVWAGPVPIQLSVSLGGVAGVTVDLDIVGVNTPLTATEESETFLNSKTSGASRIGLAQLAVTPYGTMTASASAAITAGVARAGVEGDLTLLDLRVPLTGRMWWGLTNLSPLTLKMGAWADMKLSFSAMSGEIYLFAENQSLDWCSKRVKVGFIKVTVRYPCGLSWNTFWDMEIADWNGWTWNQTLWTSPYLEYTVQ